MKRNFMELLQARWDEGKSVCVGLDSDPAKLPEHYRDPKQYSLNEGQLAFNKAIIEVTADLVCAYKPNLAFYGGANGKYTLRSTIAYVRELEPGVPVILDAKWGDIGNTNNGYIADLEWFGADAVTINPYLGAGDGLQPFLDLVDRGIIVLCKTSNDGSAEFQNLPVSMAGRRRPACDRSQYIPLYKVVADQVATEWNANGNCALVVGATAPYELAEVRRLVGDDMPILIPGIGAQGGPLEATVKAGANSRGQGMIINSSRGIIFASTGENFAGDARLASEKLQHDITSVLMAA